MIEVLFLGFIVGVFASLVPGLHTNLIAVFVVGLQLDAWFSAVFLVSVAASRSVLDIIPAVFLGASDDVMSIMPGHLFLKRGLGVDAVRFCVAGSVLGIVVAFLLLPVFLKLLPFVFSLLRPWLFWVLLALVLFLLLRDLWWAFVVFALSGFLGLFALNGLSEPLFPLLSGLFGAAGLLHSLLGSVIIPRQSRALLEVSFPKFFFSVIKGCLAAFFIVLFPGLGPSQAAALAGNRSPLYYLVMVGALGTVDVFASLVALFVLGKSRNGAVAVVEQFFGSLSGSAFVYLVLVCCVCAALSAIVALPISDFYASFVGKVNYSVISICVLFVLSLVSFLLSGFLGLLVFFTASAIGFIAPLVGISRSHAMGCLLVPTLLVLWGNVSAL